MEAQTPNVKFIVSGLHLTENLLHHKRSDVQRILDDKGFEKALGDSNDALVSYFAQPGAAASGKQTVILFDDKGFVLEEGGVELLTAEPRLKP